MSLVQEALKRKNEELRTGSASIAPTPPPPESTFQRDSAAPIQEPLAAKKRISLLSALLPPLAILLVMVLAYVAYTLIKKQRAAQTVAQAETEAPAEVQAPAAAQPPAAEPASPPPEPATQQEPSAATPPTKHSTAYTQLKKVKDISDSEKASYEEARGIVAPETVGQTTPAQPAVQTTEASKPAPPPPPPPPPAVAKPVQVDVVPAQPPPATASTKPVEPVAWPVIRLTGVMVKQGRPTSGLAYLNGKLITGGQTIEGVKLVSVHKDGVVLEFQNEIKTLRVGATLR